MLQIQRHINHTAATLEVSSSQAFVFTHDATRRQERPLYSLHLSLSLSFCLPHVFLSSVCIFHSLIHTDVFHQFIQLKMHYVFTDYNAHPSL